MKRTEKMNCFRIMSAAILGTVLLASVAPAATLLSQNFDTTSSPTDIANGATVASFTARTDAAGQAQIISANGSNVLQLTDSSTADGMPRAFALFSSTLSTDATGQNALAGSFDFCMPTSVTGTSLPSMIVGIGRGETTGDAVTAIQITINAKGNGSYSISYVNGTGANAGTAKSATLTAGVWYHVELTADFSSTLQDTYSIKVSATSNPAVALLEDSNVKTRGPNLAVNQITFMDGAKGTDYNSTNPLMQIDNLNFTSSSVPEVSALGLLAPGVLMLAARKR